MTSRHINHGRMNYKARAFGPRSLNEKWIPRTRPNNSLTEAPCRVFREGKWYQAYTMEKVREDGYLKMDMRLGWTNVRAFVKPENIECRYADWICLSCGRINGNDYVNCNGCGKGKP